MNLLSRCTKHTNWLRLACNNNPSMFDFFFLLNPNFHIIEDKKNKNKCGHLQGTHVTFSRPMRPPSAG